MARFGAEKAYTPVFWMLAIGSGIYLFWSKNIIAGILLSLLLSPMLWQHYVVMAYPLLVVLFRNKKLTGLVIAGLLMMELPWLHGKQLSVGNSLMASHYFVGLVWMLIESVKQKNYDMKRI